MKNSSNDLFLLINSLTSAEKRYFITVFEKSQRNSDASFVQLFLFILSQEQYDETAIKNHFKNTGIAKNFPQTKRFLYVKILEALDQFHSEYSIEEQIKKQIHQSKILTQKKLESQAFQLLKSAHKKIDKFELYHLYPMLAERFRALPDSLRQVNSIEKLQLEFENYQSYLDKLSKRNQAWHFNSKVNYLHHQKITIQNPKEQKALSKLIQQNELNDENLPNSFLSKLDFLKAHATYAFMQGKIEKAYQLNEQILKNFEQKSAFIRIYPFYYIATLNNFIIDNVILEKYDIVDIQLNKMMKLETDATFSKKLNIPLKIFELSTTIIANLFLTKQQFKSADTYIDSILSDLNKFKKSLKRSYLINIYYIMAYVKFANDLFEDSLAFQNELRNEYIQDIPTEMRQYLNILFLLTHFELKNYSILESLILSTKRFNSINRKLLETEKIIFKIVTEIHPSISKKEANEKLHQFQTQMIALQEKENRIYNYLDVGLWIESKINGISMAENKKGRN